MFKKPLSNLKTSSPLKSSERRKLKQKIIFYYSVTSEDGDILVPEGILSAKFTTHVNDLGVVYIGPDGDPLWFTIGKGSEELIPTIYALWKKQDLVPFLSTPSAVTSKLIGGADLMIPGVFHCPPALPENQIVAIRQYVLKDGKPAFSPPVAIGRMALPSDQLRSASREKGKAVYVSHTWKDHLWEIGSKSDIPEDTLVENSGPAQEEVQGDDNDLEEEPILEAETPPPPNGASPSPTPETSNATPTVTYTPSEVTELLNKALLQSISTSLKSLPPSAFPIPATIFYTNHILPSRPAYPTLLVEPAGFVKIDSKELPTVDTEITIKASSHKSLSAFLKASEKASLLTLKSPQKNQPDILVTAVNATHPSVSSHAVFVTIKDLDMKAAKKTAREQEQRKNETHKEINIRLLWKPHQVTVALFEAMGASKNDIYSEEQIRTLVKSYISSHDLVNPHQRILINLDDLMYSAISSSKGKAKGKDSEEVPVPRSMKREELTDRITAKMQSWFEITVDGKESVTKKGALAPIEIVMKVRQGRKTSTLITGFEPYLVIDPNEMAEDLRKACAGSTSVSPIAGRPAGSGSEVLVQGKQSAIVVEYLTSKGIPKKWIQVEDISGKK